MTRTKWRHGYICAVLALIVVTVGACSDDDKGKDAEISEFARSITIPLPTVQTTMQPPPRSSTVAAPGTAVPKYIVTPCEFLPSAPFAAIGIDIENLDTSTLVASRSEDEADTLRRSGMTAMSSCDGGGLSVQFAMFPTPAQAEAHIAVYVRANEGLPGAQSGAVPEISGATVIMAEEVGSGAVHWVNGNVAASLIVNYDQDKIAVDSVRGALVTSAESVHSQM